MDKKEYGLVLAGGGTKGAFQVGVWKALQELKINIKAIVGTSIGALNGALFLQDDLDTTIKMYENIKINNVMKIKGIKSNKNIFDLSNIFNLAADFTKQKGIDNTPLRKMIKQYIDMDKLYNSDIDFGLVTYAVKNKSPLQKFKNEIPKEQMIDYLLASACFPIFKPQNINGEAYFDGGFYDKAPSNMLIEKGYKNIHEVPALEKIVVNMRMGDIKDNSKSMGLAVKELEAICGQKAVVTKAKKSVANFKLRQDQAVGAMVTLRGAKMYEFLDKLVSIALPRVRDFRGINGKAFDGRGNYALGIKEHIIFPEVSYELVEKVRGFDVCIVTTAKTDDEAKSLLAKLGMPFRN